MKDIIKSTTLTKEQLKNINEYQENDTTIKQLQERQNELKQWLVDNFNGAVIWDTMNETKITVTTTTTNRKTLNEQKLLELVSLDDLNNCYTTKESKMTKITLTKVKD